MRLLFSEAGCNLVRLEQGKWIAAPSRGGCCGRWEWRERQKGLEVVAGAGQPLSFILIVSVQIALADVLGLVFNL